MVMYAPASVAELALPSKLASGHVGRARDNKQETTSISRSYGIVYGNNCVCKHGFFFGDDVVQCVHCYGSLTGKASAGFGCPLVPLG